MKLIKILGHSVVDYIELSNEFLTRFLERAGYHRGLYRAMQLMGVPFKDEDIGVLTEASKDGTRMFLGLMNFALRTIADHGRMPSDEEMKAFQESEERHPNHSNSL